MTMYFIQIYKIEDFTFAICGCRYYTGGSICPEAFIKANSYTEQIKQ